jgi:hypothetical protein
MNKVQKFLGKFLIPKGLYCYYRHENLKINCPFWSKDSTKPKQENGYCSWLGQGDWNINAEYPRFIKVSKRQDDGTYKNEMEDRRDPDNWPMWNMGLLWDKCKECGQNMAINEWDWYRPEDLEEMENEQSNNTKRI